jgi:hypothetical protein
MRKIHAATERYLILGLPERQDLMSRLFLIKIGFSSTI